MVQLHSHVAGAACQVDEGRRFSTVSLEYRIYVPGPLSVVDVAHDMVIDRSEPFVGRSFVCRGLLHH